VATPARRSRRGRSHRARRTRCARRASPTSAEGSPGRRSPAAGSGEGALTGRRAPGASGTDPAASAPRPRRPGPAAAAARGEDRRAARGLRRSRGRRPSPDPGGWQRAAAPGSSCRPGGPPRWRRQGTAEGGCALVAGGAAGRSWPDVTRKYVFLSLKFHGQAEAARRSPADPGAPARGRGRGDRLARRTAPWQAALPDTPVEPTVSCAYTRSLVERGPQRGSPSAYALHGCRLTATNGRVHDVVIR
jgi:hypothetical protein